MLSYKDNEDKIKKIIKTYGFSKKVMLSFFENAFNKFNTEDKKTILELFENAHSIRYWNLTLRHNHRNCQNYPKRMPGICERLFRKH